MSSSPPSGKRTVPPDGPTIVLVVLVTIRGFRALGVTVGGLRMAWTGVAGSRDTMKEKKRAAMRRIPGRERAIRNLRRSSGSVD